MTGPFAASRVDGRSDRQVIVDLVTIAAPDTVFTYQDLLAALREDVDPEERDIDMRSVYAACLNANEVLLPEHQRFLKNERKRGYRVARAEEHMSTALERRSQAQQYLERGVELLRHARVDELTEAQRTIHHGQLMIMGGLVEHMKATDQRLARQETALDDIRRRVERLEQ